MAKKKKTLPADFKEIVASGDFDRFRAVFDSCDINAYARSDFYKSTAIYFADLSDEMFRWLLDNGADINHHAGYGRMPLHEAAGGRIGHMARLLENGADANGLDSAGLTPLHHAVDCWPRTENIGLLLDHGADINAIGGYSRKTPLEYMLSCCSNTRIEGVAKAAELLVARGADVSPQCRDLVKRIGEEAEFWRADFSPEFAAQVDAGLSRLYGLFDVEPVPPRRIYDGKSPIVATAATWQKQHEELWNLLVPGSGFASTLQGEAIRISGKVSYEILDNGGVNWDADFRKMLRALARYVRQGKSLGHDSEAEMARLATSLGPDSDEKDVSKICELAVEWVLGNPDPIGFDAKSAGYER